MGTISTEEFSRMQNAGAYRDYEEPDYAQYLAAGGPSTGMNLLAWRASNFRNASAQKQTSQDRKDMGDFIDQHAGSGSDGARLTSQTGADFTKYGGVLDNYLKGAMLDNRFEGALTGSEGRLNSLLDNPDSIKESAAYKFRVGQGQEALQRSMGAKGMLNSGNRLMELTKYGQDMGSQEYDAQFGRLKGLYDTNAQAWLGDKNANTSRGGMLSDLYGKSGNLATAAATANSNDKIGWGRLYEQGRSNNMQNSLEKSKLNIGGPNPGTAGLSYSYRGY